MTAHLLTHLARRILVLDGAMGTQVHDRDLSVETDYAGLENCVDILSATRPDVIAEIHDAYLDAGADALKANSFGAMPHVLAEFDAADRAFDLAKAAAEIARDRADAASTTDHPRFVLGSMGPGTRLGSLGQITWDELVASYTTTASGLVAGGVDALLIETCQDPMQAKAAVVAGLDAIDQSGRTTGDIPILVNITIEQTGTMLVGPTIEAAYATLRGLPIAALGLNCATGPTEMSPHIHWLCRHSHLPVSCVPNAGLPALVEGRTHYPLGPEAFVEALAKFIASGVRIVGGCCGTTPEHIRQLAQMVRTLPSSPVPTGEVPAQRAEGVPSQLPPPQASSLYAPTDFRQDASFLIIGERCNASGSRAFKRLLEAEDFDGVVALARKQVREGSHILDVNVDTTERDNAADMRTVVSNLAQAVDAPLMLDSTQPATIEAGLKAAPGKCIINSTNFEEGEHRFDQICALAKRHNAAIVLGTIDEDPQEAMARTADRKLAIATRAIERATTVHGIPESDLFIDPLVLPVSTGLDSDRRSALELIDGTRRIAEAFPAVQLTCGVSNVSFGLKPVARAVLNSVLLHELTDAGMTSSIVHAGKIVPLSKIEDDQRSAALDLIYDRRRDDYDPLQAFIALFSGVESAETVRTSIADLPLEERLRQHIIDGEKEHLTESIDEALTRFAPLDIINDHLLDGMKTVGELFGAGEMQLPFVLQSAEVMKTAVAMIEPHMDHASGSTKGSIVLATVRGDVHDIGKNLVDIILTNNGYTVHNLGIKIPIADILKAYRETDADAIGLSGLLVKSVLVMEENLGELNDQSVRAPVLLGGAALSRRYADGHLRSVYNGSVLYGKDAFEALRIMDHIAKGGLGAIEQEIDERAEKRAATVRERETGCTTEHTELHRGGIGKDAVSSPGREQWESASPTSPPRGSGVPPVSATPTSPLSPAPNIPAPPFWGTRVVTDIPLPDIFAYINPTALYSVQWQMKRGKKSKAEYQQFLEDHAKPVFDRLTQRCLNETVLTPRVVYGYFPCASENNDLIVYDPGDPARERERFLFPRQPGGKQLCLSDYFRSTEACAQTGQLDTLAFTCVTVGPRVSQLTGELFKADQYQEYLYLHGIGVESAEALAELWHKRIRQELGIAGDDAPTPGELFKQKYRGCRYSFGYPACPDMSDQRKLWRLLEPGRIGCELTENDQIDPEQSTSALVVHHPAARYFGV